MSLYTPRTTTGGSSHSGPEPPEARYTTAFRTGTWPARATRQLFTNKRSRSNGAISRRRGGRPSGRKISMDRWARRRDTWRRRHAGHWSVTAVTARCGGVDSSLLSAALCRTRRAAGKAAAGATQAPRTHRNNTGSFANDGLLLTSSIMQSRQGAPLVGDGRGACPAPLMPRQRAAPPLAAAGRWCAAVVLSWCAAT